MGQCAVKRYGMSKFREPIEMTTRYDKSPKNKSLYRSKSNTKKSTMYTACYESYEYLIEGGVSEDSITVDKLIKASQRLGILISMDKFEQRKVAAKYLYKKRNMLTFTS